MHLEIKDLRVFYGKIEAIKGISVTVNQGEIVTLIGANGAGKTTAFNAICGLVKPDSGELFLDGHKHSWPQTDHLTKLGISRTLQGVGLFGDLTVLENVMMPALKLGKKMREEIEHDAIQKLKLLDIEDQALKMASQISGGQKQRVAIARALINNPSIIMGDEPTGNLDSHNAQSIHELFSKLRTELQQTFVIVTHNEDLAKSTDRIIKMQDGLIIA